MSAKIKSTNSNTFYLSMGFKFVLISSFLLTVCRILVDDFVGSYRSVNFYDVVLYISQHFLNQTILFMILFFIIIEIFFFLLSKLTSSIDSKTARYLRIIIMAGALMLVSVYYLVTQSWFPSIVSKPAIIYYIFVFIGSCLIAFINDKIRHNQFSAFFKTGTVVVLLLVITTNALSFYQKKKITNEDPNIILILIDTLRADHLSCYGYNQSTSPNIDAFAEEALLFTNCFAQSNHTKPSTASLFTSYYPSQHNVILGNRKTASGNYYSDVLDTSFTTIAEFLFEENFNTVGFLEQGQLRNYMGFAQGFIHYNTYLGGAKNINSEFLRWLQFNTQRKFFAYLHYLDVHGPYTPSEKYRRMFNKIENPSNLYEQQTNWGQFLKDIDNGKTKLNSEDILELTSFYDAEIRELDEQIGVLFQELKDKGLYENSLIILTADHGESFMEHGVLDHGTNLFDELLRIPMIIRYPNGEKKGVVTHNVQTIDVLPTILDFAKIKTNKMLMGHSLFNAINESSDYKEYPIISERKTIISIIVRKTKCIFDELNQIISLYNLESDAREQIDLSSQEPELLKKMTEIKSNWDEMIKITKAETSDKKLDKETIEKLKSLGYIK